MKLGPVAITPAAILAFAVFLWLDTENVFPLFLIAASVHELAHLSAALLCSRHYLANTTLKIDFLSAEISTGYMEPKHEAFCLLAGPAANFLLYFLALLLPYTNESILVLAGISLILGAFNLMPIVFLDGGRLLRLGLERKFANSDELSFAVSLAAAAALCSLSLMLCYFSGSGYGIFALSMTLLVKHLGCKSSDNTLK